MERAMSGRGAGGYLLLGAVMSILWLKATFAGVAAMFRAIVPL
jgi:hypothetical protein